MKYVDILQKLYEKENVSEKRFVITDPSEPMKPKILGGVNPGPTTDDVTDKTLLNDQKKPNQNQEIPGDEEIQGKSPLQVDPNTVGQNIQQPNQQDGDEQEELDIDDELSKQDEEDNGDEETNDQDKFDIYDYTEDELNNAFDELRMSIFTNNGSEEDDVEVEEQSNPEKKKPEDEPIPGDEEISPAPDEEIQGQDIADPNAIPQDSNVAQTEPNVTDPSLQEPNQNAIQGIPGQDPSLLGGNPNAMGIGGMPPEPNKPQTYSDVGRIYELKKIHARLTAIDSYLSTILDPNLLKIKTYTTKTTDMFNTVVSNLDLFKEKIDDIIVQFYKFLTELYSFLRDYFQGKNQDSDEQDEENKEDEFSFSDDNSNEEINNQKVIQNTKGDY